MKWGWWRRESPPPPEPEPEPGDGELLGILLWRLRLRDSTVTIGSTEDLGDGERLWFRVRSDDRGDKLYRAPVVAEVRTGDRARERAETATRMYLGAKWKIVDGPRQVFVPVPDITAGDVLRGEPLAVWARDLAERFTTGIL